MRVLYDRVAAIDVHKDMIKVAVRVPGGKRGSRTTDVLEYRTFYGVLQEMARELRRRGVTHVVMEASGVYTEPVYYALTELDFTEVLVVNPAHVKALRGHKTDLLTELTDRSLGWCVRTLVILARFRPRDQRRGYAAGVVRAGGAAARLA
jgi:transposase